jgi:hypothetical protein
MENLKDIKGLLEISDYSLYILISLCLLFFALLVFVILKFLKRKKVVTPLQAMKNKLKTLDLNDSKKTAYIVSKAIQLSASEQYKDLQVKMEKYKYKKEVASFSKEEKELLDAFVREFHD